MKVYGIGRTRSRQGKGEWTNARLLPYTMCIHTPMGFETMQTLVVEVDESNTIKSDARRNE